MGEDKIIEVAKIGHGLIEGQFILSSLTPVEAIENLWVLGYCFGVFDASIQAAKMDPESDGFLALSYGIQKLINDNSASKWRTEARVIYGIDHQNDPTFRAGMMAGGGDIFTFLSTKKAPLSLLAWLRDNEKLLPPRTSG